MRIRPLRRALEVALFALSSLLFDCATLEALPEGTCGNGVIDEGTEDCDTFPATCGRSSDGPRACRLTCTRGAAGGCPVGWGCSVDGFCRQATGEFDPASEPTSAGVVTLLPGDFDGDGRTDLVGAGPVGGASKARVHFFDTDARPATPVALEFPPSLPVARDFDGDGRDDLGFYLPGLAVGAVGLLSGRADRSFSPVVFSSISLPQTDARYVVVSSGPDEVLPNIIIGTTIIAVQRKDDASTFTNLSADDILGSTRLDVPSPVAPSDLVGPLRAARLFPVSTGSACGEIAGAFNGEDGQGRVVVLSPCISLPGGGAAWNNGPTSRVYVVGPRIKEGILLTDLDGDGHAELLVGTDQGVYYATADASGLSAFKRTSAHSVLPLAIVDLDLDGVLDIVTSTNVTLVDPGESDAGASEGGGLVNAARPVLAWSDVKVGFLNGDELPDLVASSPDALDLEFYGNGGDGRFTRFVLGSEQPVRAMTLGDFDGDRIEDVAYLQAPRRLDDPAGSGTAELLIAYGKAFGGPEAPRLAGRFEHATGVFTLRNPARGVNDLVVSESVLPTGAAQPDSSLTILLGTGDRATIAPLLLRDDQSQRPLKVAGGGSGSLERIRIWLPAALAAGPLTSASTVDVVALAFGLTVNLTEGRVERVVPTGFWQARSNPLASGALDTFKEVAKLDATFATVDGARLDQDILDIGTVAAVGDVDSPPDGVDEIVAITRTTQQTSGIYVVRASVLAATQEAPVPLVVPGLVVSERDRAALFDVSNDGLPDLVLLSLTPGMERLRVFRNDGHGGFLAAFTELLVPEGAGAAPPVGFAPVATGVTSEGKPRIEVAVVTSRRLLLATLRADASVFELREITHLLGSGPSSAITSVASGDFDGDGIQDLAVADSGAIRIVRQLPRLR